MQATHECQQVTQLHKIKTIMNTVHVYKYALEVDPAQCADPLLQAPFHAVMS